MRFPRRGASEGRRPRFWRPFSRWRYDQQQKWLARQERLIEAGMGAPSHVARELTRQLIELMCPEIAWAREREEQLRRHARWDAMIAGRL